MNCPRVPAINDVQSVDQAQALLRRLPEGSLVGLRSFFRDWLCLVEGECYRRTDDGLSIPPVRGHA